MASEDKVAPSPERRPLAKASVADLQEELDSVRNQQADLDQTVELLAGMIATLKSADVAEPAIDLDSGALPPPPPPPHSTVGPEGRSDPGPNSGQPDSVDLAAAAAATSTGIDSPSRPAPPAVSDSAPPPPPPVVDSAPPPPPVVDSAPPPPPPPHPSSTPHRRLLRRRHPSSTPRRRLRRPHPSSTPRRRPFRAPHRLRHRPGRSGPFHRRLPPVRARSTPFWVTSSGRPAPVDGTPPAQGDATADGTGVEHRDPSVPDVPEPLFYVPPLMEGIPEVRLPDGGQPAVAGTAEGAGNGAGVPVVRQGSTSSSLTSCRATTSWSRARRSTSGSDRLPVAGIGDQIVPPPPTALQADSVESGIGHGRRRGSGGAATTVAPAPTAASPTGPRPERPPDPSSTTQEADPAAAAEKAHPPPPVPPPPVPPPPPVAAPASVHLVDRVQRGHRDHLRRRRRRSHRDHRLGRSPSACGRGGAGRTGAGR